MTQEEIVALVNILNRAPMSPAEGLWLQALIERLKAVATQRRDEPKPA
jgi:hypothetical protein